MGNCACINPEHLKQTDYQFNLKLMNKVSHNQLLDSNLLKNKESLSPLGKTSMMTNLKQINLSISHISSISNDSIISNFHQNLSLIKHDLPKNSLFYGKKKNKNNSSTILINPKNLNNGVRTPTMKIDNFIPEEIKINLKENNKDIKHNKYSSNTDLRRPILSKLYKYSKKKKEKLE